MKLVFTLFVLILVCHGNLTAQEYTRPGHIKEIWITEMGSPAKIHGILKEVKDSSLVIFTGPKNITSKSKEYDRWIVKINYHRINMIQLRKKSAPLTGKIVGTLAGALVGRGIGDSQSKALAHRSAWIGATVGLAIGGIIGTIKSDIPIKGNFNNYSNRLIELRR